MDLPIGGTVVPKEEIKKAPILKIEVFNFVILTIFFWYR